MKRLTTFVVVLSLLGISSPLLAEPVETAAEPADPAVATADQEAGASCLELPAELETPGDARAATGCSPQQCHASCVARNYDKGTCFGDQCYCSFYYP